MKNGKVFVGIESLISILNKQKREFKMSRSTDNGLYSKTLRRKVYFYETKHPGIYKKLCELNYKLTFKNGGKIR